MSQAVAGVEKALQALQGADLDKLPEVVGSLKKQTDRVSEMADALADDNEFLLMELNVQRDTFLAVLERLTTWFSQGEKVQTSDVRALEEEQRLVFEYRHLREALEAAPEPKTGHWSFRQLSEMERQVVPFIINDLTAENIETWHPILTMITKEAVEATTKAWKTWLIYRQRGEA